MTALLGVWDATLQSPLGPIEIVLEFTDQDGSLRGTSTASGETVGLSALTVHRGDDGSARATWSADVTKPVAVHLDFDLTIASGTMSGTARAGMLMPEGPVSGVKRA
ncbi:hypothetical protein [Rhizohabitans arisaemae]|uniref:hypothetical protein n=1 Tax=Rhizohabitans arisaemae TaxID=2720610 RepID=UPI0024B21A70|nr:hypothetical protein [Rhizohabitans arisaemae]